MNNYTLILLSKYFPESAIQKLEQQLEKDRSEIKLLFCDNAAEIYYQQNDEYRDSPVEFVEEAKKDLIDKGFEIEILDLNNFIGRNELLLDLLNSLDAVYFNGGDAWTLFDYFHKTGLVDHYQKLLKEGLVHIGASAGAVVCSQKLNYYSLFKNPKYQGESYKKGLGITNLYIYPHYNYPKKSKYTDLYVQSLKRFGGKKYELHIPLANNQAIYISDSDWEILE